MSSQEDSFAWRAPGVTPLATARRALLARMHPAPRVHQTLQVMLAQRQPGASWDGASVFLALPGDVTIASALSSAVTLADEFQLRVNEGPALQTMSDDVDLLVDDTASERRWPTWSTAMVTQGWRSVHTRSVGSGGVGAALTLYAHRPEAFSASTLSAADLFARRATNAVATAMELSNGSNVEPFRFLDFAKHIVRGRHGLA